MLVNENSVQQRQSFIVYTDGSGHPMTYPNAGGWACLILGSNSLRQIASGILYSSYGGELHTTNNKMELRAIVEAVRALPAHCEVEIRTDSKYCIGMLGQGWRPKENGDLVYAYRRMVMEKDIKAVFTWVKGHSTDMFNNYVDKLTNAGDAMIMTTYNPETDNTWNLKPLPTNSSETSEPS